MGTLDRPLSPELRPLTDLHDGWRVRGAEQRCGPVGWCGRARAPARCAAVGLLAPRPVSVVSGFILSAWAMSMNPHFEGTVRIQTEVGHRVFEGGPYRCLRRPGYLGLALWALGTPLLVRSVWSIRAAVAAAAWIVLWTGLEDATPRRELEGYADYARRTRSRPIFGLW